MFYLRLFSGDDLRVIAIFYIGYLQLNLPNMTILLFTLQYTQKEQIEMFDFTRFFQKVIELDPAGSFTILFSTAKMFYKNKDCIELHFRE